ncbi:hypothetical protein NDU88_002732, partial [Pleurodeles waltl]
LTTSEKTILLGTKRRDQRILASSALNVQLWESWKEVINTCCIFVPGLTPYKSHDSASSPHKGVMLVLEFSLRCAGYPGFFVGYLLSLQ